MTNDKLATDIRAHLTSAGTLREVKMFGGIGFMLNENLTAAISKRGLLLRVGKRWPCRGDQKTRRSFG